VSADANPEVPEPARRRLSAAQARDLLTRGKLSVEGRLVDASNATLYCGVSLDGVTAACVYKPVAGERPLWDFPHGSLAGREAAAYLVSEATGWDIVPPPILREGPFGPGAVQLWIDIDEDVDLVALVRSDDPQLRRIAVYDAVVNNADRKGGHLLPVPGGHVFGVDHGVCFHTDPKLRTLLWGWAGQPLTDDAVEVLRALRTDLDGPLGAAVGEMLARDEVAATVERVEELLATRRHPEPSGDWPAVPWPPF
jgi:hypothetical protein